MKLLGAGGAVVTVTACPWWGVCPPKKGWGFNSLTMQLPGFHPSKTVVTTWNLQ